MSTPLWARSACGQSLAPYLLACPSFRVVFESGILLVTAGLGFISFTSFIFACPRGHGPLGMCVSKRGGRVP